MSARPGIAAATGLSERTWFNMVMTFGGSLDSISLGRAG